MRFSEAWLRELVNPDINTQTLADQLSMAGLEVGAVLPATGGSCTQVVIGKVRALALHPSASKLRVCQVEVDTSGTLLQIVCGAANIAVEQCVPVALVGARLPGDVHIKLAKLRGVDSYGMICSAAELGLEEQSAGILVLPATAPVGQDLQTYLGLDDKTIELNLTPDRSDCLSIIGIAREVGVINRLAVHQVAAEPVAAVIDDCCEVRLAAPDACPRYACRIIRNLNPAAQSPWWLREKLRRCGIRAISPVVDITNYVMLELGQPMHGFDLHQIDGYVEIRMARSGERMLLLDGQEISLQEDTLIIADANRPIALAGIMGSKQSAVGSTTRDILLESAFFTPHVIGGRPRAYGLATDSSHRFERGVDPSLQKLAIERATQLLVEIAGGMPGPVVDVNSPQHLPQPKSIFLRRTRVQRLLGLTLPDTEIVAILTGLGMQLEPNTEGWLITAPSTRFDIGIEADLIADLARIHGYAKIPVRKALNDTTLVAVPETRLDPERHKEVLVNRGYQEAITYSFVSSDIQELIDPNAKSIALANPLSQDLSVMRTSLWPGLLLAARYNHTHQCTRIRIFESGLGFTFHLNDLQQTLLLAGLATGAVFPEQWAVSTRNVDFFDVKADVEAILRLQHLNSIDFIPAEHPALHPGKTAQILKQSEAVGWIGALHPKIQHQLAFPFEVVVFELNLATLATTQLPKFNPLSKFPSTRRDIAIVIDRQLSYASVVACINANRQKILQDILLFDLYTNDLSSDKKSLAIGLVLQSSSHTLSDAEVNTVVNNIVQQLREVCGAVLRT